MGRVEIGGVYQLERTLTLYVMVDIVAGVGVDPPPTLKRLG
jgi:hypothetical protein